MIALSSVGDGGGREENERRGEQHHRDDEQPRDHTDKRMSPFEKDQRCALTMAMFPRAFSCVRPVSQQWESAAGRASRTGAAADGANKEHALQATRKKEWKRKVGEMA